jgi:glycerol-3-phosphate acyltransferase PlsY
MGLSAADLAAVLAAYLLGAVPFGLVFARVLKGVDLRKVGSGNIGTTNAMRVIGRPLGLVVFVLDFGKGWLPAFAFPALAGTAPDARAVVAVACGAAAVVGHCFPVYLRFKGGKGVATGFGAVVALDPWLFVIAGLAWVATLVAFRYVGLASILMGFAFPVGAYLRSGAERPEVVLGAGLLTLLILVRHRSNIRRMIAGEEPRGWSHG